MPFKIQLSSEAKVALRSLLDRKPDVQQYPALSIFIAGTSSEDFIADGPVQFLDAVYAIQFLLERLPHKNSELVDHILDHLVSSIELHGGKLVDLGQIVDLVYEALTYVRLIKNVGGIVLPPSFRDGVPDVLYKLILQNPDDLGKSETEILLHLECKNITKYSTHEKMVQKVITVLERARAQTEKRSDLSDWLAFIDLPTSYSPKMDTEQKMYIKLCVDVTRHFNDSGTEWFDDGRVLYTSTFQENMEAFLSENGIQESYLLPPVFVGQSTMPWPRTLLLSNIFTPVGQNVSPSNLLSASVLI